MKKLTVSLILACLVLSSFPQGTGDLGNQFYIRLGFSQPTKSFLGIDDRSSWHDISRIGGIFELGSIFIYNSSVLTPQIAGHNLKNKLGLIKFGNYDNRKKKIYT